MPIHIPPLRQRKDDIPKLCNHLLRKLNQEYGRNIEGLTDQALLKLKQYDWPGNVRELENVLGRAIIFMKFNEVIIDHQHIPDLSNSKKIEEKNEKFISFLEEGTLASKLEEFEKQIIIEALKQNNGNKTATAKKLGISVRNLYYKMEKYNLEEFSVQ
jgi:transcriptional regulator with PAS, ATPase and Fis domain